MSNTPAPVPCRGCLPDCPNRNRCDGKPWRLEVSEADKRAAQKVARH